MILGKRDKDYVQALEDSIASKEKEIKTLRDSKDAKDSEVKNLKRINGDLTNENMSLNTQVKQLNKRIDEELRNKDLQILELKEQILSYTHIDFDQYAEENDITFKELANILAISVSTLNKYRKDSTLMSPDRFKDVLYKMIKNEKCHCKSKH